MAKNAKELSQVKARQTKLGKKSNNELIQIIIKKDKIERNMNNQIKSLKHEVNVLSTNVSGYAKDMEGTLQTLETLKDKITVLNEKNDALALEAKEAKDLYEEENKKAITFKNKADMQKIATYIMAALAACAVIIAIL